MDSHDDRTQRDSAPRCSASQDWAPRDRARRPDRPATEPYGVAGAAAPDYRAIARQFASLSAAAARHARATGNGDLDRLAQRLDECAGAILDDIGRESRPISPPVSPVDRPRSH
ncbi:hypothetical protein [Azospirillum agricola]|uniref:hypothetical protein n=1 Tax=Azospirillum agricola TaxID=1720247 RepID=UPI000A0F0FED|nr:hypothetical protein [Azospirillum agricola]SMH54187.1 hypothetical protein SAMN02982994_3492 [Azospirillum lipoferum]